MRAIWQAAVIELAAPVRLDPMLREQGGYLDVIGGKPAAWTPRDVFYVEFDKNTLGVLRPGQRQYVTRWVTGKNQPELSPYLARAWSGAAGADVMFAMDLDDVVGATAIEYADSMGQLPSLEKMEDGREKLVAALASVQGLRLTHEGRQDDRLPVRRRFRPGRQRAGRHGQAVRHGRAEVRRRRRAGRREVAVQGRGQADRRDRRPGGGSVDAADRDARARRTREHAVAAAAGGRRRSPTATRRRRRASDPKQEAAYASQKYYRAVAGTLEQHRRQELALDGRRRGSSTRPGCIEQLPILNVDPALVRVGEYGRRRVQPRRPGAARRAAEGDRGGAGRGVARRRTRPTRRRAAATRRRKPAPPTATPSSSGARPPRPSAGPPATGR